MKPNKTAIIAATIASIPSFFVGQLSAPEQLKVQDIVAEQAQKADYVQVLEGNKIPEGDKSKLTTVLPENVSINVHSGAEGEGYSIVTRETDRIVSIGIGAYSESNTWVKDISKTSSSTKK